MPSSADASRNRARGALGRVFKLGSALAIAVVALSISNKCGLTESFKNLVSHHGVANRVQQVPRLAQLIDLGESLAMDNVAPTREHDTRNVFIPKGKTLTGLKERPFHAYHTDFLEIIGQTPALSVMAETQLDPLFHEAPIWHAPTDEMFFSQNAGHPDAGTGLNKSALVQKISLVQAMEVSSEGRGNVDVEVVRSEPQVVNPNGGTNYKGNLLFAGEGMGEHTPSALYLVNPVPPYNATVLVNNYYGTQFNSLNDVTVNPRNGDIYFTDTLYGYHQDFRPEPVLPRQVYRLDMRSKSLSVVADGFTLCNGITISPDGKYAYVTDTGINRVFNGWDLEAPSAIYRYDIASDGTFEHRKIFAHIHAGVADGIHCDRKGNVYAGCDDGVHVWNKSGMLLGKIFTGETVANFQFAGKGRMVMLAERRLYYVTLAAEGAPVY